jgi:hypothetical protein
MTKISNEIKFSNYCNLLIKNNTGFYSSSNLNGFLKETDTQDTILTHYKLSNGYFFNLLLYKYYAKDEIILNPEEEPLHLNSEDVDNEVYGNNFDRKNYKLKKDGTIKILTLFVISKEFYESKNPSFFGNKEILVYDAEEVKFYRNSLNQYQEVSLNYVISRIRGEKNATGTYGESFLFSLCHLNEYYYRLQCQIVANSIAICEDAIDKEIKSKRDLVKMFLQTLDYLQELGDLDEAQSFIEMINSCSSLFTDLNGKIKNDCGC